MIEQREGETTLKVKNHLDNMVINTQHLILISLAMYIIYLKHTINPNTFEFWKNIVCYWNCDVTI